MTGPIEMLRTERLDLEPLRIDHAAEMVPVLGDQTLYAYTGGSPPDEQELRTRYGHQVAGRSPDGTQQWLNWVLRRRDDGAAVGYVQATVERGPDGDVADVAWVIGAGHQGRGYAREAAAAMVRWLRQEGVDAVTAHVHPEHGASQSVARAIGLAETTTIVDGEVRWSTPADPVSDHEAPAAVLPPREREQADAVVRVLSDYLGDGLLAVYLHGSAVLGGLRPTSDLDLLAVTARPLPDGERTAVAAALLPLSGRPHRPLELVVVAHGDVRPWRYPPVLQLMYGEWLRAEIERGEVDGGHGDPDLAIAVDAVVRRGRSVHGPPATVLLDPVPPADVVAASLAGLPTLLADVDGDSRNVLLTLCRVWVTVASGEVVPKDVAAARVLDRLPAEFRPAVERARRMYLEGWDEVRWPDPDSVRSTAAALTSMIENLAGSV